MKVKYLAAIATAAVITIGFGINTSILSGSQSLISQTAVQANPCASKNNPCAAKKNPCAGKTNPCASKANPCAAKGNPCASKNNPCAAKSAKATKHPAYYTENGVALDGQDVVAYFTQNKPVNGNKKYSYKWKGTNWQFSSAANRDLFAKNPEKYAPAYGGYCAKAASSGYLATTVPTAWEVRNGKLYLNFSPEAQKEWLQDTPNKIVQANKNFPKILNNETLF